MMPQWLRNKVHEWDSQFDAPPIAPEHVGWRDVFDWIKWNVIGR